MGKHRDISPHRRRSSHASSSQDDVNQSPAPRTKFSPWLRKPLWVLERQEDGTLASSAAVGSDNNGQHRPIPTDDRNSPTTTENETNGREEGGCGHINRHLTLFDLISVGIGGTVGSGIFVLCGVVAHNYAGPATCLSWSIAGLCACMSGLCYAELAGRMPVEGSSYAYAYVSMGELPAVIAASCLTLEYGMSGAAVARSWGDKVVEWLSVELDGGHWVQAWLDPGMGLNPMAFVVSAASVALLLDGVKESKAVTNFFTMLKVGLVLFMTVGGFYFMDTGNFKPFLPPKFGVTGVFRGATSSFFGYLGYDEVCCIAGEAINPRRDMPLAVIVTLVSVTVLYVFAALALTGMQNYEDVSEMSAFPEAFKSNGANVAAQIAAAGEVFTLPVVVLISLMAQPRLQFALAQDGLLPKVFGEVDQTGNLRKGTLIAGIVMTAIATFVPFLYLDDLISAGILVAFSMTDCSVILMRHESPDDNPHLLERLLIELNVLSFVAGLAIRHLSGNLRFYFAPLICVATAAVAIQIGRRCPRNATFGGKRWGASMSVHVESDSSVNPYFRTPLVPYLPCFAVFVNWYLIAQLEALGLFLLVLYIGATTLSYFMFGAKNSVGNSSGGWDRNDGYDEVGEESEGAVLLRTISLPPVKRDGRIT